MTHTLKTKPTICIAAAIAAALVTVAFASLGANPAGAASSGGFGPGSPSDSGEDAATAAKYERLWDEDITVAERRWANRTARCESGRDPDAIGGGGRYRGAFQFMKSTWKRAPKSPGGDPIDYSYRTQAVVAVLLKRRAGSSPWPVCG